MSKYILITGGTGLIGREMIKHFTSEGFHVIFTSRSESKIAEVEGIYKNSIGIKVDLEGENASNIIVKFLKNEKIEPYALINNAINLAYHKIDGETLQIERENWLGHYVLSAVLPYELSINLSRYSKQLKRIVNISSMYGQAAYQPDLYNDYNSQSFPHYGTAKASMDRLTKELAVKLAPEVQVNAVAYGGIDGRVDEEFKNRYSKKCPLGRMLKKEETVGVVEFLLSDKSIGITGQVINVDGGWTIW